MENAPRHTPWGAVQQQEKLCEGLYFLSTASHGGIWVAPELRDRVPKCNNFLKSRAFWEEDCDWAIPFVVFADEIKAYKGGNEYFDRSLAAAKATIKHWHKEVEI